MDSALSILLPVAALIGSLFCGWNLWAFFRDFRRGGPIADLHRLRRAKDHGPLKWINASLAVAASAAFAIAAFVLGAIAWDSGRDAREQARGPSGPVPYYDSFDGPSWELTNTPPPLYRAAGRPGHPVIGAEFSGGVFTDEDLVQLARENPDLEWLRLTGTSVTDKGLEALRGLEHLDTLAINNAQMSDSGLKDISTIKSLRVLFLYDIKIGDCGWESLGRLQKLRSLRLVGIAISDRGIASLLELQGLENLILVECGISDEAAAELQKAMPHCAITPRQRRGPKP